MVFQPCQTGLTASNFKAIFTECSPRDMTVWFSCYHLSGGRAIDTASAVWGIHHFVTICVLFAGFFLLIFSYRINYLNYFQVKAIFSRGFLNPIEDSFFVIL